MSTERSAQLLEAGVWLRLSGDVDGARRLFQQALKADPGNADARKALTELEAPAPLATTTPPPQPGQNPFEPPDQPVPQSSESTVDGDWGVATGWGPSPPPIAPVAGPGSSSSTISLTPSSESGVKNTLPFGPSGVPPPPEPQAQRKSTIMFGPSGVQPPPEQQAPGKNTMQFGTSGVRPPPEQQAPGKSTIMFGPAGVLPRPEEEAPGKSTMQFGTSGVQPPPEEQAPGKSTMQFGTSGVQPPPEEQVPGRNTMPFGTSDGRPPPADESLTVSLDGSAPPPSPPRPTPPLFSGEPFEEASSPSQSVVLSGEGGPEETPWMTPPLFDGGAGRAMPPPLEPLPEGPPEQPEPVPPTPAVVETPPSPAPGSPPPADAWSWKGSAAARRGEQPMPDEGLPVPMPSPGLAPLAQSAWDHRSNPGIKLQDHATGKALDMISQDHPSGVLARPPTVKEQVDSLLLGAKDLLGLDDHTGAIDLIGQAQVLAPDDPSVKKMREKSELTLVTMYESKLGDMATIPRVLLKDDEVIWLNLDHRAGFVLAQIDGTVTFDDLFAVSGMSRLDTARILAQLVDEGVISRG